MASGTATPNYRGQLTANAVDTVTMDRAWPSLTIMTDASARVDFTVDGSTPAAHSRPLAGPDDYTGGYILAGSYETTVAVDPKSPATVKLVSTGSPQYSVVAEPAAGVPPLSGQYVPVSESASDVIEGVPLTVYGDSYSAATAATGGTAYATTRWFDRVVRRCGSAVGQSQGTGQAVGRVRNYAADGFYATDLALYAYGVQTMAAGEGSSVAATWPTSANNRGIAFLFCGRNDAGNDGNGGTVARHRAGFQNSLVAMMRLVRASVRTEDNNAAFVYTGTWTAAGSNYVSGANFHYTTTPNDHVTLTTPVGTDFDLILLGCDNSNAGLTGASFTITVDGSAWTPAGYPTTTADQMQKTGGQLSAQGTVPIAIPLHGLSNQAHTVVVTHTGTSGQFLMVDCLLTQSPNYPTIFIPKIPYVGTTGYSTFGHGASTAIDDIYNGIIDTVIGLFPNDGSVVTWNPNTNGWNPTYGAGGHLSAQDANGLHPNDAGTAFLADGIMGVLNNLTAREGLVTI